MDVIEAHPDALYFLESLILSVGESDESLLDLQVVDALETTRRWFAAEFAGRTFKPLLSDKRTTDLFVLLRAAGLILLGREAPEIDVSQQAKPRTIDPEALVACLKRIEKSAKLWNERGGRRGYVEFIAASLPR
jgi:hypothetical protein